VSSTSITVLVDDLLAGEGAGQGALPAHGLGLVVECALEDGVRRRLLVDGGPSRYVLEHNAAALGLELRGIDAAVACLWSSHHVAAVLDLARHRPPWKSLYTPPLPKARVREPSRLSEFPALIIPLDSPVYNERALLISSPRGYVAVVACSVYGVEVALKALKAALERLGERLVALIGGFNLSTLDAYGLRLLSKYARRNGAVVVPLHSTSLEAREKLARAFKLEEVPGVGTRVEVA